MIRQAGRLICVVFLLFFGWITAAQAFTASIDLNLNSMELTYYSLGTLNDITKENAPVLSYSSSGAYAYDKTTDSYVDDSGNSASAVLGPVAAASDSGSISCNWSEIGDYHAYAYSVFSGESTVGGLLKISVDYEFEYTDFNPDSNNYIYTDVSIGYQNNNGEENNGSGTYVYESFILNSYFDPASDGTGSGTLVLLVYLEENQAFDLTFQTYVSGETSVPLTTPVPASVIMLLSGLGCIAVFTRKKS